MHLHILGICGTFMGSLALLARELGHQVSGSDAGVYPPMSTQLAEQGIAVSEGYSVSHLQPAPDLVVIGNALSRGNPAVEHVLAQGLDYCSGPEFLARHVLPGRWVLAVAGTHGKTTTSAMLAHILDHAGLAPGFLIGGVLRDFPVSARLGESPFFVVEADEYDSAFFDKRAKFVHYRPRTLVLNNLEYDHADIYPDLAAIQRQFHHLLRTVPGNGLVLWPRADTALEAVLAQGCWSEQQQFGQEGAADSDWQLELDDAAGSRFRVRRRGRTEPVSVCWQQHGRHNVANALAAMAAAHHVGVPLPVAAEALASFAGVRRRLELVGQVRGISVYDDFAHHPTAIAATLSAMAARLQDGQSDRQRLIAVLEPRSNTMRMGVHQHSLLQACAAADFSFWLQPTTSALDLSQLVADAAAPASVHADSGDLLRALLEYCRAGDHVVIMSNGAFEGLHQRLLQAL